MANKIKLQPVFKDGKTYLPREQIQLWAKNDEIRFIETKDNAQLKADLEEFGDLSPLLINSGENWGIPGDTIGGNNRLKVYDEEGRDLIWVEIKSPVDEKQFIRMAAVHNKQYAQWHQDSLAEYLMKFRGDPAIEDLQVGLGHPVSIRSLLSNYGPNSDGSPAPAPTQDPDLNLGQDMNPYVKQIVLFFENAEYIEVMTKLEKIKKDNNLKNNTDAFLHLLKAYENNTSNA